jgi:endoglucanase
MTKSKIMLVFCMVLLFVVEPISAQKSLPLIKVEGKNFVNPSGEVVRFQGVSFADPDKIVSDGHWNRRFFEEARNWGSNLIRFAVHPRSWQKHGASAYFEILDKGVEWATDLGMYVIIDWHSIGNLNEEKFTGKGYITTMAETIDFWQQIAKRYKGNNTVAFYELFNEPTDSNGKLGNLTWATWKPTMEMLIDKVNDIDSGKIFLVAGMDWGYLLNEVPDNPVQRPNVAYVSHPYPQKRNQPWEPQWEKDWGKVADIYPIIATEFGFVGEGERGAHIPCIGDETYGEAIIRYFNKKGISYTVWVFDPNWAPAMLEDYNFTPTRQGRFFKKVMQGNFPSNAK